VGVGEGKRYPGVFHILFLFEKTVGRVEKRRFFPCFVWWGSDIHLANPYFVTSRYYTLDFSQLILRFLFLAPVFALVSFSF